MSVSWLAGRSRHSDKLDDVFNSRSERLQRDFVCAKYRYRLVSDVAVPVLCAGTAQDSGTRHRQQASGVVGWTITEHAISIDDHLP